MPFVPLHDQNPRVLIGRPWVTWGLILGSSLVYLYEALAAPDELQRLVLGLGAIPAVLTGELRIPDEFYLVPPVFTLISYQFLHGEPLHLIFNMAYLWVFGDNIEDAMGHRRFLAFFLLCGVLAALAHLAADPSSRSPIIGASGAISGTLGAYLVLHPKARVLVPVILFIPFYLPAYLLLVVWIGFQVYAVALIPGGADDGVAWWAHIGGFVAGMALIPLFRHKAIPLWRAYDLPTGLELTVRDHSPRRREPSRDRQPSRQTQEDASGKRRPKAHRRGPWG
ncbi:MAG: rhomboid family intramembrane serine protease [Rhodospirillales bacterium]|nr:rhomboid family intramembrane serine protease [Rhodospirillales bacterium]